MTIQRVAMYKIKLKKNTPAMISEGMSDVGGEMLHQITRDATLFEGEILEVLSDKNGDLVFSDEDGYIYLLAEDLNEADYDVCLDDVT